MRVAFEQNTVRVEHNAIHEMDRIESPTHLKENKKKYSDSHFNEIEAALKKVENKVRAVTFNVLFSKGDAYLPFEHRWDQRKYRVVEAIHRMDPDILGIQEPLEHQVEYLKEALSDYEYFGASDASGMHHGLFFKKDRFDCIEKESFHLESSDPKFSKVTQNPNWLSKRKEFIHLKLMDKKTAQILHVFNAHMSFFEANWREMEAHVMHDLVCTILDKDHQQVKSETAALLMGDWNTFDNRPDLAVPFLDGNRVLNILKGKEFVDARREALLGHIGPTSSFTNDPDSEKVVPFKGHGNPGIVLDHFLSSKKILPLLGAINPILIEGHFPSDHMPVVLDFLICEAR